MFHFFDVYPFLQEEWLTTKEKTLHACTFLSFVSKIFKGTKFRGENMVCVENTCYEIVEERGDGYNEEAFLNRYSEILTKYDYIVGDWGYGQLRLKGFFDDHNQKASFDTKISTVSEYLYEFCNFGCAYFILKKTKK